MDIVQIVDQLGETPTAALFGLMTGAIFGVAAQRSAFCLRAATVEFARGELGPRMAVWLLTFSTALVWVQAAEMSGLMRSSEARMMAVTGSWSGAILGGLLFGVGMVLARGVFWSTAGSCCHRQPARSGVRSDLCGCRANVACGLAGTAAGQGRGALGHAGRA